jgi:pimeloyl-ACP methyl ester carboxylesterase
MEIAAAGGHNIILIGHSWGWETVWLVAIILPPVTLRRALKQLKFMVS